MRSSSSGPKSQGTADHRFGIRPEVTKRPSDTHKRTKQEREARPARETRGIQPLPARRVSGALTGPRYPPRRPSEIYNPLFSLKCRVTLVPAASAYVSNPDVSLVLAI